MHAAPFPHFATEAIHAGQPPDPRTGAVIVPISLATTFYQESPGKMQTGYEYGRTNNPTRQAYEECIAKLENGKHGLAFASGMASISTIVHLLRPGDEIIAIDDIYKGTTRYFQIAAELSGLIITSSPINDIGSFKAQISEKTKLIWLESLTNPTLKIVNIQEVASAAHEINPNILVVVDNTFLSPYFQRPLDLGVDIVVHSTSKYINGHSDVVGGVVVVNDDSLNTRLRFLQNGVGAIQSPFDSFLSMRGVKTLSLRMKKHAKNALAVAKYLESHEKVERVIYPGLASHPQHEIAKKQQKGYGGMISFYIKGDLSRAIVFLENVQLFTLAESLGGTESLCEHPAVMTHSTVDPDKRKLLGISDTLIRLSVGIEDIEDIIADVDRALTFV